MERSQTIRALIFSASVLAALIVVAACNNNNADEVRGSAGADTPSVAIDSTDPAELMDTAVFDITTETVRLRNDTFPRPQGRVVNIMITGIDGRMGDYSKRADANHLVRFFLDSGMVEIISIPRDTYADAGFDDTTTFNKLTNVRAHLGRRAYLDAVSEITGVEPINLHIEFGFSQAIGLLELLGYKSNAVKTLRVLRDRQTFRAGDFQRSYNQGRFIRRVLLKNADRLDDLVGELALRAALMMVETNLTYEKCDEIFSEMKKHGFNSKAESKVWVRLEPPIVTRLQQFDFNPTTIDSVHRRLEYQVKKKGLDSASKSTKTVNSRVFELIESAALDTAKSPKKVVRKLKRPFDQRVWLQVTNEADRNRFREQIGTMLADAYQRIGLPGSAESVRKYIAEEAILIEGR